MDTQGVPLYQQSNQQRCKYQTIKLFFNLTGVTLNFGDAFNKPTTLRFGEAFNEKDIFRHLYLFYADHLRLNIKFDPMAEDSDD